jgi:DNA polymerase III epsilon subunit-like protein
MMEFVAIDVETANPDMASICQIGLAWYRDGALTEEWKSYIDTLARKMGSNLYSLLKNPE